MFRSTKISMAATVLLCITLLLSACSNSSTGNSLANGAAQASANQPQVTTAVSDEAASPQTKIVSTSKGDVEGPINPQRVVTDYYAGYLLAMKDLG